MFMYGYICSMYLYIYLTAKLEDPINFKSPVLNEVTVCMQACMNMYIHVRTVILVTYIHSK
jgi:hypothetical protein